MKLLLNIIGILVVLAIALLLSWDRRNIPWKTVGKGLAVQFIIAILLVKLPIGRTIVSAVSDVVTAVIGCGQSGLDFVFGSLNDGSAGYIFIIQTLGNIIFVSALVGVLYYIGVLGVVVKVIGRIVGKLMGTTEVESFVAVANMFLGQTDSPILVSKYLRNLTDSEVFVILVSGMGSMSVSILGGYHALGIPMEYLLIASAMVPIGSILLSKIILPQAAPAQVSSGVRMDNKGDNSNVIDALAEGASTGMTMVLAIGANLVGVIGMIAVVDLILSAANITLADIFSYVFAPFGYLMGLEGQEIMMAGRLLGTKLIANEFIAFQDLGGIIGTLDERTALICSLSLCGFANVSSIGICVGGIGVLCPEKRPTLARLVVRAMLGGVLVSLLSALIVGVITLF